MGYPLDTSLGRRDQIAVQPRPRWGLRLASLNAGQKPQGLMVFVYRCFNRQNSRAVPMAVDRYQRWSIAIGLLGLSLGLVGCPQGDVQAIAETKQVQPTAAVQTAAASKPLPVPEQRVVPYEICRELSDWERPSLDTQQQALAANPRYSEGLDQEPLRSLSEKFWTQPIIAFTTYGLSARMEPINLSGVWTIADETWTCYEGDRPDVINQGEMAELWVIGHRVASLEWSEGQYLLTVVPTGPGIQFIQFERQEHDPTLPLAVITADGETVSAVSGDW